MTLKNWIKTYSGRINVNNYRQILARHFEKRRSINPRFSLRAFAAQLNMPASKLSEVLNEKKGISPSRANEIASILKLAGEEREIFNLSVRAMHSRNPKDKVTFQAELENYLVGIKSKKSTQLNAWYFGAVKVIEESRVSTNNAIADFLGLTKLQIENAKRYIKRMAKLYPDRKKILFDKSSVIKKINTEFLESDRNVHIESRFIYLTSEEIEILREKFLSQKPKKGEDLYMVSLIDIKLGKGE